MKPNTLGTDMDYLLREKFLVSNKKCSYNNNTGDGWHGCGKCKKAPSNPFNFCLREGYGEIIEVPNRGRYRVFRTGTTIVLELEFGFSPPNRLDSAYQNQYSRLDSKAESLG